MVKISHYGVIVGFEDGIKVDVSEPLVKIIKALFDNKKVNNVGVPTYTSKSIVQFQAGVFCGSVSLLRKPFLDKMLKMMPDDLEPDLQAIYRVLYQVLRKGLSVSTTNKIDLGALNDALGQFIESIKGHDDIKIGDTERLQLVKVVNYVGSVILSFNNTRAQFDALLGEGGPIEKISDRLLLMQQCCTLLTPDHATGADSAVDPSAIRKKIDNILQLIDDGTRTSPDPWALSYAPICNAAIQATEKLASSVLTLDLSPLESDAKLADFKSRLAEKQTVVENTTASVLQQFGDAIKPLASQRSTIEYYAGQLSAI